MGGTCTTGCGELTTAYLCHTCTGRLRAVLRDVVELALGAELRRAAHRAVRLTRTVDHLGAPTAEQPLPVDLDAANLGDALNDTFAAWVRHVAATMASDRALGPVCHACAGAPLPGHGSCSAILGTRNPAAHPSALAQWLATNVDYIRTLPTSGELLDELDAITRAATRAVDLPESSILAGACPECAGPVYTAQDATHGRCRTPGCDGVVRVDQGRADHLDTITRADAEYTAADAARVMTALGEPVTRAQINQWHRRGHLTPSSWAPPRSTTRPRPVDQDDQTSATKGRPRFRLGDLRARRRAALNRSRSA
ncbi:hypothetical protein [Nocardiopsis alba]|uniref:hypothetical protein n=1 Tax=Nocardiopsis alba TaxID=53437 RepID=UPI0035DCF89C